MKKKLLEDALLGPPVMRVLGDGTKVPVTCRCGQLLRADVSDVMSVVLGILRDRDETMARLAKAEFVCLNCRAHGDVIARLSGNAEVSEEKESQDL